MSKNPSGKQLIDNILKGEAPSKKKKKPLECDWMKLFSYI